MLQYIISRYKNESYIFSDTVSHFNNFHFAVIGNSPSIFSTLLEFNNAHQFISEKNAYGFTPLHYFFSQSFDYNPSLKENNQFQMNNILVSYLTEEDILKHTYNGYDFIYFSEIMKEKNLTLYQLLQKKFPFHLVIANRLELQKKISQQLHNSLQPIINSYKDED